uniref:Secreted protein n=1 Tax=Sander lucioperca TaxID=283035 RepID=A0A8C9XVT0_SANLU
MNHWKTSLCCIVYVYLCRLWTPPSIWADVVLFSNFRSPEYIMALPDGKKFHYTHQTSRGRNTIQALGKEYSATQTLGNIWSGSQGFCPWHPGSPCRGISSLHWWQPAESPSSLERD